LKPLPRGTTIASSEVGYLGVAAPQVNVIDLEGLNDTQIALHGFQVDTLLARKPDIIWMPHTDYTYQRGLLMSDPGLLQQYDLYAGAADYGLAFRKDSAVRPQLDAQFQALWKSCYPGYLMEDYRVSAASWSKRKYLAANE
jgi:hypothetical protein